MQIRNNYSPRTTSILLLAAILVSACAGGSKVRLSDAALSGDPSAMWAEGQKSVQTGEDLVSKGEKRLAEGRKQIRDGEVSIDAGNRQVRQERQNYQNAVLAGGRSSTPTEVDAEAKRLRAIGNRWEDAIDEIKKGNKLVDKGNKNIDRGQAEIREGRKLLEQGSTLMRNSQRARTGAKLLPVPEADQ